MGVVYLARDTESGRKVALKVLPPELTRNPKYVERFQREASAVSKLNHPNIIHIYAIGEEEQTHYFAMEYLGGPTLRQSLAQKKRLELAEAVSIILQIADALDAAHAQAIIHRDVKPDNIMADEEGKFKIMDFGIAHTEEGTRLTVTGTIMGTPEYMSPEQASGTAIDRRSDIYSLGVVLYELLTGKAPFKAQTAMEVLQMHITKMPESPKLLNPEIPTNVANVIAKMLEKQPSNRYDSFRHVINALSQAVPESMRAAGTSVKEIQAAPVREKERPAARVRERVILQTPASVRLALAASLILNIALFGYLVIRKNYLPEAAEPPRPVFSLGGQVFAPPAMLGQTLLVAGEDGALRAVDVASGALQWTFKTGDKITAAPVVDGDRVYVGSWDQHLYALEGQSGNLLWKAPIGGCIFAAPIVSNGTLYVCTREGKVVAIDAATGEPQWNEQTARTSQQPALQDGTLFIASDDGKVIALNAGDGTQRGEFATGRLKSPLLPADHEVFYAAHDDVSGKDELAAVAISPSFSPASLTAGNARWKTALESSSDR